MDCLQNLKKEINNSVVDPSARVVLEGHSLLEGSVLHATSHYVGGIEGASEYRFVLRK